MGAIAKLAGQHGLTDPALLSAALQALSESLAVLRAGRIVYANSAFAQMVGVSSPRELQGCVLEDFFPPSFVTLMGGAIPGGWISAVTAKEFSYARRDGALLELKVSCSWFRCRGEEFQVISASEIKPKESAPELLLESQRLEVLGRLAAGVTHDFNNLLQYVQEIRTASEQGAAMVRQLLSLSRPQPVDACLLCLNELIADMRGLLLRLIGENIALVTSLAGDLGLVRLARAQVQQIVLNLLLNARDAMPEGGQITVTTRNCAAAPNCDAEPPGACVELTVADTGCGMDAETRARVFEPFFTTKGSGHGLGLATAFNIVKQSGGTIAVESEPGKGTRIAVRLPQVAQATTFHAQRRGEPL
jgi:two-component system, cell cycle sensor histidine kinase and response regulator CckA